MDVLILLVNVNSSVEGWGKGCGRVGQGMWEGWGKGCGRGGVRDVGEVRDVGGVGQGCGR